MRGRIIGLPAIWGIVCSSVLLAADSIPEQKGQFCWPMQFGGVVLGISQDSHVQRLLGPGILRSDPGDRTRYYLDPKRSATLRVLMFTDTIVGEVSVATGVDPAIPATELAKAMSKFFNPLEGFGNWHALQLGSSKRDVLKNLGEPRTRENADEWVYESRCAGDLPRFFTLYFSNGRIYRVVFSAPPG